MSDTPDRPVDGDGATIVPREPPEPTPAAPEAAPAAQPPTAIGDTSGPAGDPTPDKDDTPAALPPSATPEQLEPASPAVPASPATAPQPESTAPPAQTASPTTTDRPVLPPTPAPTTSSPTAAQPGAPADTARQTPVASPAPGVAGANPRLATDVANRPVPGSVANRGVDPVGVVGPTRSSEPAGSSPSTSSAAPPGMTDDVDREVADAMASMAPADLAELTGGAGADDAALDAPSLAPGTELTGTVVGVSGNDVFVSFGAKAQGVLPRLQFGKKEPVEPGRRVDVVVDRYDADAGLLIVARKGQLQRATWANLTRGMLVEGRVTGMNKGGLEVDLKGIRAFMPASQVDIVPMKDISVLLNEKIRAEVIELDRRGKNVLVSRRKVLQRELAEDKQKLLAELEVGQVRRGVVSNITEFGAFVDLGGVDGLVHISDLSWGTVEKVGDVLAPGQEVNVKLLKINKRRDRISLGIKQTCPNPWDNVPTRYAQGATIKVRIVRITSFGAFAELEPGVEALIPVSEMSWGHVRRPADAVSVGDMVDATVLRIDMKRQRIALSMKQAAQDPWAGVTESFTPDSVTHGKVTRLTDFGAFVEVVPGVEGLVHISELSNNRVRACSDVVSEGQEVEVRILGVDTEHRRLSLSMRKAVTPSEATETPADKLKKKRKKPLRGGLAGSWDWG